MAAWCILLWWKMKCENQGKIWVLLEHTPTNFDWEILFALLILKNKGLFSIVFFIFETHTIYLSLQEKKWTLFERV